MVYPHFTAHPLGSHNCLQQHETNTRPCSREAILRSPCSESVSIMRLAFFGWWQMPSFENCIYSWGAGPLFGHEQCKYTLQVRQLSVASTQENAKSCHTTRRKTVTALQCTANRNCCRHVFLQKLVTLDQENVVKESALLSFIRPPDAAARRFASASAFNTRVCGTKSGFEVTTEQL